MRTRGEADFGFLQRKGAAALSSSCSHINLRPSGCGFLGFFYPQLSNFWMGIDVTSDPSCFSVLQTSSLFIKKKGKVIFTARFFTQRDLIICFILFCFYQCNHLLMSHILYILLFHCLNVSLVMFLNLLYDALLNCDHTKAPYELKRFD